MCCTCVFLAMTQDEMVPPQQMYDLYEAQKAKGCKLVEFPSAHHMDAFDVEPRRYWAALSDFVSQLE